MAKRNLKLPKPRKTPPLGEHPHHDHEHGKHHHDHDELVAAFLQLERTFLMLSQNVQDALSTQDQKLAALNAKVDAFIAGGGNTSADNQAIVDHLNAQGAVVDQISAKLTTTP